MKKLQAYLVSIFAFYFLVGCASGNFRHLAGEGQTFFVDSDGGIDTNDGLSEQSAWKTLSRIPIERIIPGTTILLRSGGFWNEKLKIAASGTVSAPIVIGSYGSGSSPVLSGARDVTGQLWTQVNPNVWSSALISDDESPPERIFVDSLPLADTLRKLKPELLKNEMEWAWNSDKLYFFSSKAPNTLGKKIEVLVIICCCFI